MTLPCQHLQISNSKGTPKGNLFNRCRFSRFRFTENCFTPPVKIKMFFSAVALYLKINQIALILCAFHLINNLFDNAYFQCLFFMQYRLCFKLPAKIGIKFSGLRHPARAPAVEQYRHSGLKRPLYLLQGLGGNRQLRSRCDGQINVHDHALDLHLGCRIKTVGNLIEIPFTPNLRVHHAILSRPLPLDFLIRCVRFCLNRCKLRRIFRFPARRICFPHGFLARQLSFPKNTFVPFLYF